MCIRDSWFLSASGQHTANSWAHYVLVRDSSSATLYKNGASIGTDTTLTGGTPVTDTTYNPRISWAANGNDYKYGGNIDQFIIYKKALSQSEIDTLYNSGSGTSSPDTGDMLVHYDFETQDSVLHNVATPTTTTPVYSYRNFADLGFDENTERFVGQEFASATSLNTALDGTNNGATTGETGKLGSAWSFDGSNDYVSTTWLPQELQADNPFSVSLWFKTTSTGWGSLINSWGTQNGSGNNGWNLIDTGTSASFRISSNWGASPQDAIRVNTGTNSAFSDGNWHHLVVTYDGTDHTGVTYYLDGSEESSSADLTGNVGSITYDLSLIHI